MTNSSVTSTPLYRLRTPDDPPLQASAERTKGNTIKITCDLDVGRCEILAPEIEKKKKPGEDA